MALSSKIRPLSDFEHIARTLGATVKMMNKLKLIKNGLTDPGIYVADDCIPLRQAVSQGNISMKALVHGHYPGEAMSKKTLPGLLSVGYWNAEEPQDWGLDWHRNEGLELSFMKSGYVDFSTVDYTKSIAPGEMTVCGPWQLHRLGSPHIGVGILQWFILDQGVRNSTQKWSWPSWIVLTEEDLDELARLLLFNPTPVLPATSKMSQCWEQLFKAIRDNHKCSHLSSITVYINEILLLLLALLREPQRKCVSTEPSLASERIVRVFLEELKHIPMQLERPWTVAEMARACRMSETGFTRYCRRITNLSPVNYLNRCRIDFALRIMQEAPEKSITEIAMKCGFSTSQYFDAVFKKWTGKTPTEYKGEKGAG